MWTRRDRKFSLTLNWNTFDTPWTHEKEEATFSNQWLPGQQPHLKLHASDLTKLAENCKAFQIIHPSTYFNFILPVLILPNFLSPL